MISYGIPAIHQVKAAERPDVTPPFAKPMKKYGMEQNNPKNRPKTLDNMV